ncbi:MAG: hypothetical protein EPN20_06945 [Magnetospirillum sp.]|nr:MAG: hypothetical protein EPN20_06945 [Magnetospirillum sp.]
MSVVVDMGGGELYSLMVAPVGDVLSLPEVEIGCNPATIDQTWREFSIGIYRLDGDLMVVFDITKLPNFIKNS